MDLDAQVRFVRNWKAILLPVHSSANQWVHCQRLNVRIESSFRDESLYRRSLFMLGTARGFPLVWRVGAPRWNNGHFSLFCDSRRLFGGVLAGNQVFESERTGYASLCSIFCAAGNCRLQCQFHWAWSMRSEKTDPPEWTVRLQLKKRSSCMKMLNRRQFCKPNSYRHYSLKG